MSRYFYFWRLGWVAFVVLLLVGLGINLIGRGTLLLITGNANMAVVGSDDFVFRLAITFGAFLLIGLPYTGWVFELGVRKSSVLRKGSGQSQTTKES